MDRVFGRVSVRAAAEQANRLSATALRRARQADNYPADGFWQLTDQNTIDGSWGTTFNGIHVTLRRGSTDDLWRGRTEPFYDGGSTVPLGSEISIRRVTDTMCEPKRL